MEPQGTLTIGMQQLHDTAAGWSAEVSALGLAPGQWPGEIVVLDRGATRHFFHEASAYTAAGELSHMSYRSGMGHWLTVLND